VRPIVILATTAPLLVPVVTSFRCNDGRATQPGSEPEEEKIPLTL
jgi:hypothetical protein